jgi:hypothetical protein
LPPTFFALETFSTFFETFEESAREFASNSPALIARESNATSGITPSTERRLHGNESTVQLLS